jgi:hypothetical protein
VFEADQLTREAEQEILVLAQNFAVQANRGRF